MRRKNVRFSRPVRYAYTVIIVIGTLFVLALLLPCTCGSREKARKTSCLSNLKQSALATSMYTQDNDEQFPPARTWMDVEVPYTKNMAVFRCPILLGQTNRLEETYSNPADPKKDHTLYGHAFNRDLALAKVHTIHAPANTPLCFDSNVFSRNASVPPAFVANPPRSEGGNNIAYVDGHARWVRALKIQNR